MTAETTARAQSVPQTDPFVLSDGLTLAVADREPFVRLPQQLVPAPGKLVDVEEMEDWIVAAYIAQVYQRDEAAPCVQALANLSGRSPARVKASLRRMVARGWIGMAKVRNEWAPGRFGMKWRIWLGKGSPIRELVDTKTTSLQWVAVPSRIARQRSVLLVSAYLLLHEQRRVDGAIVTTPTDVASLLGCCTRTARRLMRACGLVPLEDARPGRGLWDMPTLFERSESTTFELFGQTVRVLGDRERASARWRLLNGALTAAGVDVRSAYDLAVGELTSRGIAIRFDLLVRVMEERYRRELLGQPTYSWCVTARLGYRMRAGLKQLVRRERDALHTVRMDARERAQIAHVATHALRAAACTTCDGDGWQITRHDDGNEYAHRCPDCSG